MSKVSFPSVTSEDEGWDSEVNDTVDILESQPFPITDYANIAGLPAASQNEEGLAVAKVNDDADYTGPIVVVSDGTNWDKLAPQSTEVTELTDSSGGSTDGTVAAVSGSGDDTNINNNFSELATTVNNILAAMKDTGAMASA